MEQRDQTAVALSRAVSRRTLLGGAGAAVLAGLLSGCGVDPALGTLGVTPEGQIGGASQGSGQDWGQGGVLRVGMEAGYPPNNWQEEEPNDMNIPIENVDGAYANGYDVQIAKRLADALSLEPLAVKMEFTGLISALNSGQIDIIIAGMANTPERAQSINFSDYYTPQIDYVILVLKGSRFEGATSLEDFRGATILGQSQTMLDTVIDQIPDVNHATPVDSTSDMLARLQNGTVDGITSDIFAARGYVNNNPDIAMVVFDQGKGFELEANGSCAGIRKNDDDLLQLVNDALAEIPEDERTELMNWAVDNQPAA